MKMYLSSFSFRVFQVFGRTVFEFCFRTLVVILVSDFFSLYQAGQNVSISPRTVSYQCLPNFRMISVFSCCHFWKKERLLCVATKAETAHTVNLCEMEDARPSITHWARRMESARLVKPVVSGSGTSTSLGQ